MKPPICLITPPSCFLMDERVFVSLGILKVAACLEQAGHSVEMVDLSGIQNFEDCIQDHASQSQCATFGITATTPQMPAVTKIVKSIRSARPGVRIILGGPHVTLVNAALKRERKIGSQGRATRAFAKLLDAFDVLVCGDGEDAIFAAIEPDAEKVIDADDPKSSMWMTNDRLNELPFPARHLVDMGSYHYTIEGERSLSLIAQLGCLDGDTLILMESGEQCPIRDVQSGAMVRCYDTETNEHKIMPVEKTWSREADDLHELEWSDGTKLRVTGEHPLWTTQGWRCVHEINPGESVAKMPHLPAPIYRNKVPSREVLQLPMSRSLAADALQSNMAEERAGCHAKEMASNDATTATCEKQHQATQGRRKNPSGPPYIFRDQNGRSESHEASRGGGKSIAHDQKEVGELLLGSDEEKMEVGQNQAVLDPRRDQRGTEQIGVQTFSNFGSSASGVPLRRERRFLDRPMFVGQAAKSRFHKSQGKEGDSSARRVLALQGVKPNRSRGLRWKIVEPARCVVPGTEDERARKVDRKTPLLWARLIRKTFIGKSKVFNITVHPVHTYFANQLLVHNCPFCCTFCGGRESPMLRRIRTRTTENIIKEVLHLHRDYGANGFMFYDDELNVNPSMIELMDGLRSAQDEAGVEFKMRGFIKSQLFTDAQAAAMHRAGFRWILVGFESGSERILTNIKKKANRAENTRCMEIAKRHGLKVKALMSVGHAGESAETISDTERWLIEVQPDDFDATVISVYAGTPYHDWAVESSPNVWTYTSDNGDRLHSFELDYAESAGYYKGKIGEYQSYVFTDFLEPKQLVALRDNLETSVRAKLGIPFNQSAASIQYEHSMGQPGNLPRHILRRSE